VSFTPDPVKPKQHDGEICALRRPDSSRRRSSGPDYSRRASRGAKAAA